MGGNPETPVVIGRLTQPYGIKGWIKVFSYTEPKENLLGYRHCLLQQGGEWRELELEDGKPHGKGLVVKLQGVETPEQARLYSGCELGIPASSLPQLPPDEYYWHQLQGLAVWTTQGEQLLGRVDHLLETGANDVLVVQPCEGSIDQRERLIPYLPDQVVLAIDLAAGTLRADWDPEF